MPARWTGAVLELAGLLGGEDDEVVHVSLS